MAHTAVAVLGMDAEVVAAVLDDYDRAPIDERLRATLALVEAMTLRPGESFAEPLARARRAGLDADAVEDAANVTFHFNYINRVADALDFDLPQGRRGKALARMLDLVKRLISVERPRPSTVMTADGIVRPVEIEAGYWTLLTSPGSLEPAARLEAEAFTARLRGGRRAGGEPAEPARGYLEKLTLHAYRITDEDVQALLEAGYDQDGVFDLTQAGAWGAAVAGLENVLGELTGAARA